MTLMLWDTDKEDSVTRKYEHHTEFVLGVDFSLFNENQIASCSWDQRVCVWDLTTKQPFR